MINVETLSAEHLALRAFFLALVSASKTFRTLDPATEAAWAETAAEVNKREWPANTKQ